jgi:hypothetical protein
MIVSSGPGIDPEAYRCGAHYFAVAGSIDHRGREVEPINPAEINSIAAQLQKAGIQVLDEEASSQSAFEGILNVRLKFADPEPAKKQFPTDDKSGDIIEKVDVKKRYIYAIRFNLRQLVSLKRDPSAEVFSITWQTESVGMRRLALIKDDIKSLADVFIEAFFSENPNTIKR